MTGTSKLERLVKKRDKARAATSTRAAPADEEAPADDGSDAPPDEGSDARPDDGSDAPPDKSSSLVADVSSLASLESRVDAERAAVAATLATAEPRDVRRGGLWYAADSFDGGEPSADRHGLAVLATRPWREACAELRRQAVTWARGTGAAVAAAARACRRETVAPAPAYEASSTAFVTRAPASNVDNGSRRVAATPRPRLESSKTGRGDAAAAT